jgi:hypothetical protein
MDELNAYIIKPKSAKFLSSLSLQPKVNKWVFRVIIKNKLDTYEKKEKSLVIQVQIIIGKNGR